MSVPQNTKALSQPLGPRLGKHLISISSSATRSLMKIRVEVSTPPSGTPCLYRNFLMRKLPKLTRALRLKKYDFSHLYILPSSFQKQTTRSYPAKAHRRSTPVMRVTFFLRRHPLSLGQGTMYLQSILDV